MDDFNNGVILTNRILRPNEVFEVRLDRLVEKWAGSIEIGLTTHQPSELDFPSTMTNIRSGTWMMTGNGVMHNGSTIIEDYGLNLDRLKVRRQTWGGADLRPKWFSLVPNGTNPGLFQISFQYIFAR